MNIKFAPFFISAFSDTQSINELNTFLKSHKIINIEKEFIESPRSTGWAILVEYVDTNLFYKITDFENLICAYFKARCGKMLEVSLLHFDSDTEHGQNTDRTTICKKRHISII